MTNGGRTGGHDITVVFSSDNGVGDVRVSPRVVEPSSERRFVSWFGWPLLCVLVACAHAAGSCL